MAQIDPSARKKTYYHIRCAEHGRAHSLDLLVAIRQGCDVVLTVCPAFLEHQETIEELFGVRVMRPTQLLAETTKEPNP